MSNNSIGKLVLVQQNGGKKLPLTAGSMIILGRSRITQIKDTRLSKKHLKLVLTPTGRVTIEHIGKNPSTIKGVVAQPGFVGSLSPGDKLELLEGKHEFELVMEKSEARKEAVKLNNHWSNGLIQSMNDPNLIWYQNDDICIIKDKFPKAMYHFLVLPRKENIPNLKKLTNQHVTLIQNMIECADSYVTKELVSKNSELEFRCGFHAIPSMAQVHMHVISQDFISPCLKTKKHWNSFNTPYFIDADKVLEYLSKEGSIPNNIEQEAKKWLANDVKCHKCSHKPRGMGIPFKQHLETHLS